jgi:hypothetical protein
VCERVRVRMCERVRVASLSVLLVHYLYHCIKQNAKTKLFETLVCIHKIDCCVIGWITKKTNQKIRGKKVKNKKAN